MLITKTTPGLRFAKTLILAFLSLAALPSFAATHIAILIDGEAEIYQQLATLYQQEVTELTEGEFKLNFSINTPKNNDWNYQGIQNKYRQLQNDNNVDMVLTLGLVSSLVAAYDHSPNKPTFAPYVIDANFPGLPRDGSSSGVKNLSYLAEDVAIQKDLEQFKSITDFKHLTFLLDQSIFNAISDLPLKAQQVAQRLGAQASFVLQDQDNQNLLAQLPEGTDAVIVTPLPRMDNTAMKNLVDGLIERKIPSFSVVSLEQVDQGLLMSTQSKKDDSRRARRTALNIQSTLLGQQPAYFPVVFNPDEELVINMRTARSIEIYPRFDILSQAKLLHEEPEGADPALSLQDVAHEAIQANLDVIASNLTVLAGRQDVKIARSALFPQLSIAGSSTLRDDSGTSVTLGSAAEQSTQGQITLSQLIYSEATRASYDIQKLQQLSREAQHRSVELDIVQQATVGFLNVLRAQTQVEISQSQLNLSTLNLNLAKNRLQVGSANAADVYRFESQIATDRQALLQAQASLQSAREALNNLLHRPIGVVFKTVPATLEHDEILFHGSDLENLIDNQRSLQLFQDLYIKLGQQLSPEVAQQDAQIAVSQRQLKASKRSYYVPDVSIQGNTSRIFDEQDRQAGVSLEDENDWEVSLNLSLPLYQGGQRKASVRRADYDLSRNYVLRDQALRQVEQNVRQNFNEMSASYPSIELSEKAAASAAKNYELIQDNYSQGTVGIADLIDAQNAKLTAELNAANAVYDFLIDLMNLQRSIGAFDYFLDSPSREQRIELIKNQIQTGG